MTPKARRGHHEDVSLERPLAPPKRASAMLDKKDKSAAMKTHEIQEIVEQGEGYFVEFKERIGAGLDREMVAFANSSGGKIIIGITDDGRVIGCPLDNSIRSRIQDIANNCDPRISIRIETTKYEKKSLLLILVAESLDKPVGCSKGFFLREGPNSQKLTRNEILSLAARTGKFKFDMQVCRTFDYQEGFEDKKWHQFLDRAGIAHPKNRKNLLLNLGLAEDGSEYRLTNAGVLFFGKNIEHHVRHSFVTCVLYKGTTKTKILDRKDYKTDLLSNHKNAFSFLQQHLRLEYIIKTGGPRIEIPEIPLEALREALLNAIVHRDYYEEGAGIFVEIYDDRVEITNPGRLLFDKAKFGKLSVARNPLIFDIFYRLGLSERVGSGISRMREAMAAEDLEIEFDPGDFFIVTFSRPYAAQKSLKRPQATPQAMSETEMTILRFCEKARTRLEIIDFMQMNPDYIRKQVIPTLIEKGLLGLTIPNKPRSPYQKYILTEAGKKGLAKL